MPRASCALAAALTGFIASRRSKRPASRSFRAFLSPSRFCSKTCCASKTASRSKRRHRIRRQVGPVGCRRAKSISARRACCLQDFTGVPCVVDLAAMRDALDETGRRSEASANPLIPVDLVIDHSVQVDKFGTSGLLRLQRAARIPAQSGALCVSELGPIVVSEFPRGAARYRHRAPGESRISGAGGFRQRRRGVSRYAGRHRFAHHHDQRPGRGRLGRRRH